MDTACEFCYRMFNNRSTKHDHKIAHHFGGLYCDLCNHHVFKRCSLRKHYQTIHGIRALVAGKEYCQFNKMEREYITEAYLQSDHQRLDLIIQDLRQIIPSRVPEQSVIFPSVDWGDVAKPLHGYEDSDIVGIVPASTLEYSINPGSIDPSTFTPHPVSQPECAQHNREEIQYRLLEVIDESILDTPLVTDELIEQFKAEMSQHLGQETTDQLQMMDQDADYI